MRKTIFLKFIQVIVAALVLNSAIFYVASSSALLKNSRKDMLYTLEALDQVLNYEKELNEQIRLLEVAANDNKSRFTVVDLSGQVIADTGVSDPEKLENHRERQEIIDAINQGEGYSIRKSGTLNENMLYVALKSDQADYVLRMAIPYTGMREFLILLLPAVWLSFLVAIMYSAFSADSFSKSVTKPLKEISQEMLKVNGDYRELSFETYQYPEINIIAETTTKMSENVKEYCNQLELEKQIRQEFFSNASHELKTPITSIQGYAELLENGLIQNEDQRLDFARRIKKEAIHMTALINDILMISRLETKEADVVKSDVRMSIVLDDILDTIKPYAALQEVLIHCDCKPLCIHANGQQMTELLNNLITNAVKYNKPGGQVWVTVKEENGNMVIIVRDNGVGIPKESQSRIFERFYRVDKGRSKRQGGTGLGLSIVKHIVSYNHGTISVKSVLEEGSEFMVKIPIS